MASSRTELGESLDPPFPTILPGNLSRLDGGGKLTFQLTEKVAGGMTWVA